MLKSYTIRFVPTARKDLVQMKTYILNKFKYPEYGVNFDKKIKGEEEFLGRGVSYCATCDAMLYKGKKVVIIGATPKEEMEAEGA